MADKNDDRGFDVNFLEDFSKCSVDGFVHVFDEVSFERILHELDTVTDFVNYLSDKEKFLTNSRLTNIVMEGSEEDLLAYYMSNNRKFPEENSTVILAEGIWETFEKTPEYESKKHADQDSYIWDRIIQIISEDIQD